MSKIICANGDSFTSQYYLNPVKNRWTNQVGVTKNLALPGGSNERIFNTTIHYLNSNIPDILIIGWTDWGRFMLPSSDGSRFFLTPHYTALEKTMNEFQSKLSKDVGEFYYKNLHNSYTNFENMLNYMLFIHDYCINKRIKLLYFFSTVDERWWNERTVQNLSSTKKQQEHLDNLITKIDEKIWIFKKFYSMCEHCKNFKQNETLHPMEEGSAHWANLVKQYL